MAGFAGRSVIGVNVRTQVSSIAVGSHLCVDVQPDHAAALRRLRRRSLRALRVLRVLRLLR